MKAMNLRSTLYKGSGLPPGLQFVAPPTSESPRFPTQPHPQVLGEIPGSSPGYFKDTYAWLTTDVAPAAGVRMSSPLHSQQPQGSATIPSTPVIHSLEYFTLEDNFNESIGARDDVSDIELPGPQLDVRRQSYQAPTPTRPRMLPFNTTTKTQLRKLLISVVDKVKKQLGVLARVSQSDMAVARDQEQRDLAGDVKGLKSSKALTQPEPEARSLRSQPDKWNGPVLGAICEE